MQVLHGQMYISGETRGFEDIQDRMKKLLVKVWTHYQDRLPDVDMMIQFDDWMLPNLEGERPGTFLICIATNACRAFGKR